MTWHRAYKHAMATQNDNHWNGCSRQKQKQTPHTGRRCKWLTGQKLHHFHITDHKQFLFRFFSFLFFSFQSTSTLYSVTVSFRGSPSPVSNETGLLLIYVFIIILRYYYCIFRVKYHCCSFRLIRMIPWQC